MRLSKSTVALAVAGAVFGASVALGQGAAQLPRFAVPPYKNLKVLPPDITRPQLLGTMKLFSQSLGVRCTFCHAGAEGAPLTAIDFASDAKDKKATARKMLAMVHRINKEEFGVQDFSQVKVTCFTCHRGSTKPLTAPPADAAVPPPTKAGKPERGAS